MTDVVSLKSLAAEVARVHARLDEQARERAEAELRIVTMLAAPETPEERRACFTLIPGTARHRTPPRGHLHAVTG